MKGKLLPLLAGAGVLGAYFLYRNWQNFSKTYRAGVGRIKFNAKDTQRSLFTKAFFDINIIVTNPSSFTGIVRAIKLDVLVNNRVLGTVNQSLQVNIEKQGDTVIPISVGINTLGLFTNISEAIKALGAKKPIEIRVVGTVLTNYGAVKIDNATTASY
jgi:hypothetical protein